jgi:alkanesulfonate monooxygenase SsuD/methylene tetrahydromethanopterin reductase-like flavin-dependent oxidoreductase (luciferase family)
LASTAEASVSDSDQTIAGPPEHWAAALAHFATDLASETFLLVGPPDPRALGTFIDEVAPRVRERVAELRAARVEA